MTVLPPIGRVAGPNLALRLIEPDDAEYVHALRTDPAYNLHLSEVLGTVDDQRRWIAAYKAREAARQEAYYVIERKDGIRCGLVRLYDIGVTNFTWGSWILDDNKPKKAALESAYLVYVIAFDRLGLMEACFDVRIENDRTVAFHIRFGAIETSRTKHDVYFSYPKVRFESDREEHLRLLISARNEVGVQS